MKLNSRTTQQQKIENRIRRLSNYFNYSNIGL